MSNISHTESANLTQKHFQKLMLMNHMIKYRFVDKLFTFDHTFSHWGKDAYHVRSWSTPILYIDFHLKHGTLLPATIQIREFKVVLVGSSLQNLHTGNINSSSISDIYIYDPFCSKISCLFAAKLS